MVNKYELKSNGLDNHPISYTFIYQSLSNYKMFYLLIKSKFRMTTNY
jgi:hypothetical protein